MQFTIKNILASLALFAIVTNTMAAAAGKKATSETHAGLNWNDKLAAMNQDKQAKIGSEIQTANTNSTTLKKRTVLAAPNANSVLILSTTNGQEANTAAALGFTAVQVSPAQWATMTQSDYASYRAIILGDRFCSSVADVAAAEANVNVWSPVVKGNILIDGTDPSFHLTFGANNAGALKLQSDAISYAANNAGQTGAFINLSCYYAGSSSTRVNVLNGFGDFEVQGVSTCDGSEHIVNPQPSTPLASLTDGDLQNWFCSAHELFTSFPSDFKSFATVNDPVAGVKPYILTRTANCCEGLVSGSACCSGVNGSDVSYCLNQQIYAKINTCSGPVSHCQNYALGTSGGLLIQSSVCTA